MEKKNIFQKELFHNPPAACRPMPFWFINSTLEEKEIRKQIRDFHEKGVGGVYFHARFGLEVPYMGKEWFSALRACISEAEKCGMEVWIYDENLFPSGIGNLEVSRQERFKPRFVECASVPVEKGKARKFVLEDPERYGLYLENSQVFFVGVLSDDQSPRPFEFSVEEGRLTCHLPEGIETLSVLCESTVSHPNNMIFGVNYLAPEFFEEFARVGLEPYKKEIGEHFGKTVKGFFTDEPTLLPWHHNGAWYMKRQNGMVFPYTHEVLERVRDVCPEVQELPDLACVMLYDCGNAPEINAKIRNAYYQVVGQLYTQRFFEKYANWCERNHLLLTGHLLLEEGLYYPHIFHGGSVNPLGKMHIPACDQLSKNNEMTSMEYMVGKSPFLPRMLTNNTGPKQVSSVAYKNGRRYVLSESFGCGGFSIQYGDMKKIVDWEYVLGVNKLCPHAFFYSIEGFRKYDAPACHYHSPLFKEFSLFSDYVGRLSYVLSVGAPCANVAVLYPDTGFRSVYAIGRQRKADKSISDTYELTQKYLLEHSHSYLILDKEDIKESSIRDGKLFLEGEQETDPQGVYASKKELAFTHVIVPDLPLTDKKTKALLGEWENKGVRVVELSPDDLPEGAEEKYAQLEKILDEGLREIPRPVSSSKPLYVLSRKTQGEELYFSLNPNQAPIRVKARAGKKYRYLLDSQTGKIHSLTEEDLREGIALNAKESLLLLFSDVPVEESEAYCPPCLEKMEPVALPVQDWVLSLSGWNTIPLKEWDFAIIPSQSGNLYRYTAAFFSEDRMPGWMILDDIAYRTSLMGVMDITVLLNGRPLVMSPDTYLDKGMKVFSGGEVLAGENQLQVIISHNAWCGQPLVLNETAFFAGDFRVTDCETVGERTWYHVQAAENSRLVSLGDITSQGCPFYSGEFRFTRRLTLPAFSQGYLSLKGFGTLSVSIDGKPLGKSIFGEALLPVEQTYSEKTVELEITCLNTLGNLFSFSAPSGVDGGILFFRK